ncbi:phage integrase family protein [Caballeronia terrestris]|uniref:Phage integrase family protein n=1 Tax=Caballeronia terrestris TaxID=1226301 RepID=A0A158KS15_9BURK|nr:site-specific integrase [Caballeronia terrestris]SAL83523.1 phage integrase family protein [Caballeronia terrestris]
MVTRLNSPVVPAEAASRALQRPKFHRLAAVPAEAEWFANLDNPRTRRAYRIDLQDFMGFAGIMRPDEFRLVNRAHVLAWRKTLEERALSRATIRRKLAALSSLFEYLCEKNAAALNLVKGTKRPKVDGNEGKTRRSAITRRAHCSMRRTRQSSRASAIARGFRCRCFTACAPRSCAC